MKTKTLSEKDVQNIVKNEIGNMVVDGSSIKLKKKLYDVTWLANETGVSRNTILKYINDIPDSENRSGRRWIFKSPEKAIKWVWKNKKGRGRPKKIYVCKYCGKENDI